jgi:hypothetical protein
MSARALTLVFNGQRYSVPGVNFPGEVRSATELPVKSAVSQEAFNGFLDFCIRRPVAITAETAFGILDLCEEFHIRRWADQIAEWIDANRDALLVKRVARAHAKGGAAYRELCATLKARLGAHLGSPDLAALPLAVLRDVFQGAPVHSPPYFRVFVAALKKSGPTASALFSGADFAQLSAAQLLALLETPEFVWAFVAAEVGAAQGSAGGEIRRLTEEISAHGPLHAPAHAPERRSKCVGSEEV